MDGIAGVYSLGKKDNGLVEKIFLATGANQHRGKASAGIAVGNGKGIYIHKGLDRIGNVIDGELMQTYQDLEPIAAIGNVGYTKNKHPSPINAEPIRVMPRNNSRFDMVLTTDGYLVSENDLKEELLPEYRLETTNKTEVIGALLHKYITQEGKVNFQAGRRLIDKLQRRATFALTALVYDGKQTRLVTLNDSKAFEPFCYGTIDDTFIASSESCSHRRLGGFMEREYNGAEMTICSTNGAETRRLKQEIMTPDIFQAIYFGHVGSMFRGKEIFQIRRELGHELVRKYGGQDLQIIISNPDSGWGVSVGVAEELGRMCYPALIKQAQAVRTFQESERRRRSSEVGLKFGGIDSLLKGKKVGMGDDSIVKGSVSEGGSLWVLFNSGIDKLNFYVSYGPMLFPSFKEWHRKDCVKELAAQRAFGYKNQYGRTTEEANEAVSKLMAAAAKVDGERVNVFYNNQETIRKIAGNGSFQALDASYPIDEKFWPEFIKKEAEKYIKTR